VTASGKTRPHFGRGELELPPARCVFINCPFDPAYAAIFDAIVFTVVSCGFMPRSALESGNVAEQRMERIARAIFSSRYSIHDLSRCTGSGDENFARFNMPLELGMAMARRWMHKGEEHDWLVLVPNGHSYQRFASDLGGFDPEPHDGTTESVVPAVVAWLAQRPDAVSNVTPSSILESLPAFVAEKNRLTVAWRRSPPWSDLVLSAMSIARQVP